MVYENMMGALEIVQESVPNLSACFNSGINDAHISQGQKNNNGTPHPWNAHELYESHLVVSHSDHGYLEVLKLKGGIGFF